MGQVAYLGLCLLGCLILSSSTPLEGPQAKVEMPLPGKSEESKENKIPASAPAAPAVNGPRANVEMPPPGKSEESKENKIPAAPAAANGANNNQRNPKASCPHEAYYFRRNCYEYFDIPVSWYTAEAECQKLRHDSHLVSFSSSNEEKMISTFIRSYSSDADSAWTGLNAAPERGILVWEWSDGSPYTSGAPLWDDHSPSTTISSEACVSLRNILNPSANPRWAQENCDHGFPYVCKYKA